MVQRYTPKIKVGTAKTIAKNLLATPKGKKVSDTKFKKFLKQDKDLKKFVYSSKQSTIRQPQAKKFFNKVLSSAHGDPKLKVSPIVAKKMGIKISRQGQVSQIGLKKIYKKASTEELASQQKPTGPSPEELRRQKRHEEAIKTFHKRERAEEIQRETGPVEQQNKNGEPDRRRVTPSISPSGVRGGAIPASGSTSSLSDQTIPTQRSGAAPTNAYLISLLIFPLNNLSTNVEDLDLITKKINNLVRQTITSLKMFKIIRQQDINEALKKHRLERMPIIIDEVTMENIAKEVQAQLYIFGTIKKTGAIMEINIQMVNAENNQHLPLVTIKEEADDIFDLERKISWQITNAFQDRENDKETPTPSSGEAVDLPI